MMSTQIKASAERSRAGLWVWAATFVTAAVTIFLVSREQQQFSAIRAQEVALTQSFNRSNAAVITLDKEGTITTATAGVYALTGYEPEELLGKSPEYLMPLAYRAAHRAGYARVLAGHYPHEHQILCHIRTKVGKNIMVLNHVFGYESGGIAVISRADDAVQTRIYQMGLEAANVGVWWWDIDQDRLVWDSEQFRIFGVDEETWTPSYRGFEQLIHPDDRDWIKEVVAQCLANNTAYRAVFRAIRPSGELVYIRAYGRVFSESPVRVFAGVNILVQADEYTGKVEAIIR